MKRLQPETPHEAPASLGRPPGEPLTSVIAGRRVRPGARDPIERENPGRSAEIAARWYPATPDDAGAAMDAAAAALPAWSSVPPAGRAALLARWLDLIESRAPELARIITAENGKTLREARSEITAGLADARHALADAGARGHAEPAHAPGSAVEAATEFAPVGVCLLVTPWNFPLATILRKLVPALVHGNTAVVKPSEFTPGPACALFALLHELSLPPGTASLVLGEGPVVGPVLVHHPALRAISFTGSTGVGQTLQRQTCGRDVRLQLEMGGKNSLVVLADADLDAAVEAAIVGGFSCAGQWCTGTGRVIVEQSLREAFVERLAMLVSQLRVGPGDDDTTQVGPLFSAARVAFAREVVAAAVAAGARALSNETVPESGHFVAPTVLDGATETMAAFVEELFVPVLPVAVAKDADDAVRLANLGAYGLSASVFSRDVARAAALARRIEAGIVHVNLHTAYRTPDLPVSAWRESGRGLPECGRFSRDFFTRPRAMYLHRG